MPVVKNFPKSVSNAALQSGLIVQSRPKVDANESGVEQGTFQFLCLNDRYTKFRPARGTPCSQFKAGDDLTKRILADFDYVGAQTRSFTRNGHCPGIGLLEVMVQGAIFDGNSADIPGVITPASGDDPITIPYAPSSAVADTASVDIRWPQLYFPPDAMLDDTLVLRTTVEYKAIELHFEYMARDLAKRPRFLKDTYALAADGIGKSIVIDGSGTVRELLIERTKTEKLVAFSLATYGSPALTGVSGSLLVGDIVAIPETTWRRRVQYIGSGTRFEQIPAGQYFHVIETATIKIDGLPSNTDGADWPPS